MDINRIFMPEQIEVGTWLQFLRVVPYLLYPTDDMITCACVPVGRSLLIGSYL